LRTTHKYYKYYGGRGINVCKEWENSYITFSQWARANGYRDNLQIDRINNNKGYSPQNCRWTSGKINCNNTRRNLNLTAWGTTQTLSEWVKDKRAIVSYDTIWLRIKRLGWKPEEALSTPKLKNQFDILKSKIVATTLLTSA